MVMKVLARGRQPERKLYRGKCSNCNTLTQAERRDLIERESGSYKKGKFVKSDETVLVGPCPVCQIEVTFTEYIKGEKVKGKNKGKQEEEE